MIRIGTSGWVYEHWEGIFYPEELAQDEYLPHFAKTFNSVEINNTFYNLPNEETVEGWRENAPKDFLFAVKASRYITHMKNLLDPEEGVGNLLDVIEELKDHLGPILFQLPPGWNVNPERLQNFTDFLPKKHRYTFEFRDDSWYTDEIFEILEDHNCAFCIHDKPEVPSPLEVTADFVYVRFHGNWEGSHDGDYTSSQLEWWAEKIESWQDEDRDVYLYFNNDMHGYAIENGKELKEILGVTL